MPFVWCSTYSSTYQSSSSVALEPWKSLGLLDNSLPFRAVLFLFFPLHKLHLLQFIPDIIIIILSRLRPSSWSSCFSCFQHFHSIPSPYVNHVLSYPFNLRRLSSYYWPFIPLSRIFSMSNFLRRGWWCSITVDMYIVHEPPCMQVLPFDDNLCVREPCLNYEECLTVLKFGNASGFISSDTVLFRPIYPVTTFACRCPRGFTG